MLTHIELNSLIAVENVLYVHKRLAKIAGGGCIGCSGPTVWKLNNVWMYSIIRSCCAPYLDYETILHEGKCHS